MQMTFCEKGSLAPRQASSILSSFPIAFCRELLLFALLGLPLIVTCRVEAQAQKPPASFLIEPISFIEPGKAEAATANRRGVEFAKRGNLEAAVAKFNEAVHGDPGNKYPHYNLALAHAARSQWGEALSQLAIATRIDPGFAEAYEARAAVLDATGNPKGAASDRAISKELTNRARGAPNPGLVELAAQPVTRDLDDTAAFIHIQDSELEVWISRRTGMVEQMVSKRPHPVELIPSLRAGLHLYLDNLVTGEFILFNRATINQPEGSSLPINATVVPEKSDIAVANLTYSLEGGVFRIGMEIHFTRDDPHRYRVGYFQSLDTAGWPDQLPDWSAQPSNKRLILQHSFGRRIQYAAGWSNAVYPMMMLRRKDRYLVYGDTELGGTVVLAPNLYPNCSPSAFLQPTRLQKGSTIRFQLVFHALDRAQGDYIEALRWYANQLTFHDKSGQIPVSLRNWPRRTMPPGMIVVYNLQYRPIEALQEATARAAKYRMTNLWFGGWDNWRQQHPSTGNWILATGEKRTADWLKGRINQLHKMGFRVHLYFNQYAFFSDEELANPEEVSEAPYKKWMNRNPDGSHRTFYKSNPPSTWHQRTGIKGKISACEIDFTNPEARAWYIGRVKACVEAFSADGVAFDYGWSYWNALAPASYDADSDLYKGFMWVQYEIARWLREKYPEKRQLQNYGQGTPSAIFADACLLENGADPAKGKQGFVLAGRATETVTCNYLDLFADKRDLKLDDRAIRDRTVLLALYGTALGAPLGGNINLALVESPAGSWEFRIPVLERLHPFFRFSAAANSLPHLADTQAVVTVPGMVASCWAGDGQFLAAAYNHKSDKVGLNVTIPTSYLERNNVSPAGIARQLRYTIAHPDGTWVEVDSFKAVIDKGKLGISGKLARSEALLVESKKPAALTPPKPKAETVKSAP